MGLYQEGGAKANKLTLNVSKTKYILFRPKSTNVDFNALTLKIGNKKIETIGNDCKKIYAKLYPGCFT